MRVRAMVEGRKMCFFRAQMVAQLLLVGKEVINNKEEEGKSFTLQQ